MKPVLGYRNGQPSDQPGNPAQRRSCARPRPISASPAQDRQESRSGTLEPAAQAMKRTPLFCTWCQKPNDRYATLCYDCWLKAVEWQALAARQVALAIKRGELSRPETQRCVDCGRRARQYDHRLYAAPLQVEPVCRSCNAKRGPALDFLSPQKPA